MGEKGIRRQKSDSNSRVVALHSVLRRLTESGFVRHTKNWIVQPVQLTR